MSTTSKGHSAEREAAKYLESLDYLVSSRRHIGGSGDLVAIAPLSQPWTDNLLVEIKEVKAGPFANCGPEARAQLFETAIEYGLVPVILHRHKPSGDWHFYHSDTWPKERKQAA